MNRKEFEEWVEKFKTHFKIVGRSGYPEHPVHAKVSVEIVDGVITLATYDFENKCFWMKEIFITKEGLVDGPIKQIPVGEGKR